MYIHTYIYIIFIYSIHIVPSNKMPLKTLIILRVYTPEKANSSPLKNDGWKAIFSFWVANFQVRAVNIVNFPGAAQFSTPTTSPFLTLERLPFPPPSPPKKDVFGVQECNDINQITCFFLRGEDVFWGESSYKKWPEIFQPSWMIVQRLLCGGGFKCVLFSPRILGKWSNLTNIFQMHWNNHLDCDFCSAVRSHHPKKHRTSKQVVKETIKPCNTYPPGN